MKTSKKSEPASSPAVAVHTSRQTYRVVLEDGWELTGTSFGAERTVTGEVVFNTGMTGYVETLTDPSYRGQILVSTYPLVGNYGVPAPHRGEGLAHPYESSEVQVQGFLVQHYSESYSHHAAQRSLGDWLREENVVGISGIDTRTLTRRLREHGTMKGWLFPDDVSLEEAQRTADGVDMKEEVFRLVAPEAPIEYPGGKLRILLVDVGVKDSIARSLLARGATVLRVPWHARLAEHALGADGIVIGNGPGDPKDLGPLVEQVKGLLGNYRKPIFGICLGNQILSRAAGADTFKLAYGHRGVNQPVQDLLTRNCYITSQNHGYAVSEAELPDGWEPWFVNLHDGTNEGIRARHFPYFSVQFHPEACPGPKDTGFLFDEFLRLVGSMAMR